MRGERCPILSLQKIFFTREEFTMDEHKKDELREMGIRSDRIMTSQEVMNAAINQKSVERAKDMDIGCFGWLLIGFGMVIILIATIQVIFA